MKKITRNKIIIFIITIMLSIIYFGITSKSHAAEVVETWDISKKDGESNVTATLYDDGNFVISGTGKMENYFYDATSRPFYNEIEEYEDYYAHDGEFNVFSVLFYFLVQLVGRHHSMQVPS